MNKDNIITLPNPHLRQASKKVSVITADVKKLAKDMEKAMLDWEDSRQHEIGVALAAVQVDKLLKVVVVRKNPEDKTKRTFQVLVNPKITKREGEIKEDFEGCLSITDIYGKVPRHTKVRVKALDLNGEEIRLKAEGFLARVLQHEIDHTEGIVFIDHIKNKPKNFFKLTPEGKMEALDYAKSIKNNSVLWK